MSNVMSLKGFRNHVSRNGFDLSRKNAFTAKTGELLPVATIECLPGDKFKINGQAFARTQPVNTAAFTRIREYYDVFFVPYRLLWNLFPQWITQMDDAQHAYDFQTPMSVGEKYQPYFSLRDVLVQLKSWIDDGHSLDGVQDGSQLNSFGFNRGVLALKLLDYLGYGDYRGFIGSDGSFTIPMSDKDLTNLALNPWPLLSYQKIYQDYFRNSQWERSSPETFNVNYVFSASDKAKNLAKIPCLYDDTYLGFTFFDLHYCNWPKDYFMGLMPEAQYGETAVASPLSGILTGVVHSGVTGEPIKDADKLFVRLNDGLTVGNTRYDNTAGLSVLALRQAEFLQRWKEIALSGNKDYKSQMEKHWNVNVSDTLSDRCQYVGGWSSNFDISEVLNTNLADSSSDADIAGKGVGAAQGTVNFECKEHGVLMVMYHNLPLLDYMDMGIKRFNTKTAVTDYAIPELDKVGMETVGIQELLFTYRDLNSGASALLSPDAVLGYAPRYVDYKTSYDEIHGAFSDTLRHWVSPLDGNYFARFITQSGTLKDKVLLNKEFFRVPPTILNSIFAVQADEKTSTDQFLINSYFDIKAVRNLDYNGLPY